MCRGSYGRRVYLSCRARYWRRVYLSAVLSMLGGYIYSKGFLWEEGISVCRASYGRRVYLSAGLAMGGRSIHLKGSYQRVESH
jgi:hypothetical protein